MEYFGTLRLSTPRAFGMETENIYELVGYRQGEKSLARLKVVGKNLASTIEEQGFRDSCGIIRGPIKPEEDKK